MKCNSEYSVAFYGVFVVLLTFCGSVCEGGGELYTALVDLEKVLHAERNVANDLRRYIVNEEQRLARLKRVADDFDRHSSEKLADVERYLGNPVNAYLLIKRFTNDWNDVIENEIRSNATEEFLASVAAQTGFFPDQDDLTGAAFALLRLQDTYALPSATIARGELQGVRDSPKLTASDCFLLGNIAYSNGDYYHTVLWMNEALELATVEPVPTVDKSLLLDYLSYSYYKQGNVMHALNHTLEWLRLDPNHFRAQSNRHYYEQEIDHREQNSGYRYAAEDETRVNPRPRDSYKMSEEFQNYERLCRGEKTHPRNDQHLMTCQLRRHHPSLFIRPAREEVVNLSPRMVLYHQLISDRAVEKVKQLATPRLARSVVYHKSDSGSTTVQDYRISKSGWLPDDVDVTVARMSRILSVAANLSLETAEQMQVLNYGIGGHYEPHYDFATNRELNTFEREIGNRVATFICYLTDVPAGGGTVFPGIGVSFWPEKGSCVLWFNLLTNGDGDYRTRHAACPVLTGFKWVCNKWFHERGQEFIRRCSPKQTI